jgi:hypothetical protein
VDGGAIADVAGNGVDDDTPIGLSAGGFSTSSIKLVISLVLIVLLSYPYFSKNSFFIFGKIFIISKVVLGSKYLVMSSIYHFFALNPLKDF